MRGGFLPITADGTAANPFGIAALGGLAGLFSKQAADKMSEVFDTLFRSDKPAFRSDALKNPMPRVGSIEPKSMSPATEDPTIRLIGGGFTADSIVQVNGKTRQSRLVGPKEINVTLAREDLAVGKLLLKVVNPEPGGGESSPVTLTISD